MTARRTARRARTATAGRGWSRLAWLILFVLFVWGAYERGRIVAPGPDAEPGARSGEVRRGLDAGTRAIAEAARTGRSDVPVEASGIVQKVLPDDRDGSRHQRLLVRLADDRTVLIAHNIDLAPRVADVLRGDPIRFKGEYEWNDKGGVVHWTHRDPAGRHPGGWIEHGGRRYD
jgi:hypothetical protein